MKTDAERQFARGLLWLEDVESGVASLMRAVAMARPDLVAIASARLEELLEMEEFADWFSKCKWKRARKVLVAVEIALDMSDLYRKVIELKKSLDGPHQA